MTKLTVKVVDNPRWLAHRCQLEAEMNDMTACPFMGADCPLGIVSCGKVAAKDWAELLGEGEGNADEEDHAED